MRNLLYNILNRKNRTRGTKTDLNGHLGDLTLEEVFPHLIISNFTSTIDSDEKMWVTTSMLARFESFTDDLIVLQNGKIIGTVGWREILKPLVNNSTSSFFVDTTTIDHANRDVLIVFPGTKMRKFLPEMYKRQRESAILQTCNSFSSISSRSILEIGLQLDPCILVSDLPPRKITSFVQEDNIEKIVRDMIRDDISVLTLENTSSFISAQMIFEKIVNDLKYLKHTDYFLELPISDFQLKNAKMISSSTTIVEMCKIMLNMKHPFVMTLEQFLTPKDVLGALTNYGISKMKCRT